VVHLKTNPSIVECCSCGEHYPIRGDTILFCEPGQPLDDLDALKGRLKKKLGKLYYSHFRPLLAPAYPFRLRRYLAKYADPATRLVIDLGSGNYRVHPDVFTVDIVQYENVDMVCDATRLPFRDSSIDLVTTSHVLEHAPSPETMISEIMRITRPGGFGVHVVPFLYPFHASPDDYQRYTNVGMARLFPGWAVKDQVPTAGPFSLFNAVVAELFSTVLSRNNGKMKAIIYLLVAAILSPVKYLDVLFCGHPAFLPLAAVTLTTVEKPIVNDCSD
tara:strand:+ start:119 stop:940 length:822 start_codon:yes stop_codon:yes gene_type:complete